jgi:hypothetical protein
MAFKKTAAVKKTRTKNHRGAQLRPIGVLRSVLKKRKGAPRQGSEGAPDAWLEVEAFAAAGLDRLRTGEEIIDRRFCYALS